MGYRVPKTSFAFQKFSDAVLEHFKTIDPATIDFSFPEPTTTFDRHHDTDGRRAHLRADLDAGR